MKKKLFSVLLLLALAMTACNMPAPANATSTMTKTPTASSGTTRKVEDDGVAPVVISATASSKVIYYGDLSCQPREVEYVIIVQDDSQLNLAQFGYFLDGENIPDWALRDSPFFQDIAPIPWMLGTVPAGQNTFRQTVTSETIEADLVNTNLPGDKHILEFTARFIDQAGNTSLVFPAEFRASDRSGEYVADAPTFPDVSVLPCLSSIALTPEAPIVVVPTYTATPYLERVSPTESPALPLTPEFVSGYAELYNDEGVDYENSGGAIEMVYLASNGNYANADQTIGQRGGGGTVWAQWGAGSAPSYDDCRSLSYWNPGIYIAPSNYLCYITDQGNYGYMHVDSIERVGTSEIQPWRLSFSYTTWLP